MRTTAIRVVKVHSVHPKPMSLIVAAKTEKNIRRFVFGSLSLCKNKLKSLIFVKHRKEHTSHCRLKINGYRATFMAICPFEYILFLC